MQEQPLWTTQMADRSVDSPSDDATSSAEPTTTGPRWFSVLALFAFLLLLRFVVPYLAEEVSYSIQRGRERAAYEAATAQLQETPFTGLSIGYQAIAKRVSPSVVHINVQSVQPDLVGDGFYFNRPRETEGQGSGVIMDSRGYLVTNYHVVRNASEIEVGLSDGRRVTGDLIGADPLTDIAVIRVDAGELIAAEWGDSDRLEVGAPVWALGSPFGLQSSITHGILSAKNRGELAGNTFQDFLQTDAAVNPGNSGGPLVDSNGNVVGINTAIVGPSYQGISFAVPSSIAREVYDRLVADGRVARGWLGVEMNPVTEVLAEQLRIEPRGAFVVKVSPGIRGSGPSPALQAGISPGDIIIAWNEMEVGTPTDLSRAVASTPVGDEAEVRLLRDGREITMRVKVGLRPRNR